MSIKVNLSNVRISVPGSVEQKDQVTEARIREVIQGPEGDHVIGAYVDQDLQSPTHGNLFIEMSTGELINAGLIGAEIEGLTLVEVYQLLQSALDGDPNNDNLTVPDFRIWYEAGKL